MLLIAADKNLMEIKQWFLDYDKNLKRLRTY